MGKLQGTAAALLYEFGVGCCGAFKKARAAGLVNARTITSTEELSPKRGGGMDKRYEGRGQEVSAIPWRRRWTRGMKETAAAARGGQVGC